ncbi:MAG: hypothetical protein HOP11_15165 [Saprospiraceae bacterium]|nr:hypothetical protein [Saprospiraceae bacterium]
MKRILFGFFILGCFIVIFSFNSLKHEPYYSAAEVSMMEGFYLFSDNKPIGL